MSLIPAIHPTYAQLKQAEQAIAQLPPVDCPVTHHFAEGVYGREMFIPAGTVISGKIHRFSTLNILAQGEIEVTTPEGVRRLCAPSVFVSPAGGKKIGFAVTDVVWINVHASRITDLAALEEKFIIPEQPLVIERKS